MFSLEIWSVIFAGLLKSLLDIFMGKWKAYGLLRAHVHVNMPLGYKHAHEHQYGHDHNHPRHF